LGFEDAALEALIKGVEKYIDERFNDGSWVRMSRGVVTEVLSNNNYSVKINGAVYAVSCCTEQIFIIGDIVLVIFNNNDFGQKYIIGKA